MLEARSAKLTQQSQPETRFSFGLFLVIATHFHVTHVWLISLGIISNCVYQRWKQGFPSLRSPDIRRCQ